MSYLALRHLHLTCVVVSVTLFVLRGGLGLWGVDWRRRWPVLRWLPHANDSVLMAAGVGLMVWSAQYPGAQHPWLAAKLVLLLAYIVAGKQALRADLPAKHQAPWFALALVCVGSMVTLALTRWGG
ncbi:SirB2 family protein [Hydrogenophaga defluvii]|uniref:SirB2 family protein n=1 Tax=Hydrogenophaga defluvii TaxID=249410 RepID=A0ABW2SDK9_9BURK